MFRSEHQGDISNGGWRHLECMAGYVKTDGIPIVELEPVTASIISGESTVLGNSIKYSSELRSVSLDARELIWSMCH